MKGSFFMNKTLPIYRFKDTIVESVKRHEVTIITAETGSGKSTQVPQMLYENGYEVVVTEPRRMAAWSLAERVSEEMNCQLGDIVGFRTGFERNDSANTSILYCTDGLELVRTLADTTNKPKVLVIDEVHEWNLNIETLIAWSKKMLSNGWRTKVVIMSATLEKEKLSNYFDDVATIEVPGSLYPVSFEQRDSEDLIYTIQQMIANGKNTLVFVPGKKEISHILDKLSYENAVVLPLHGELTSSEQKKCFNSYSLPKIIVATNVAQTSITIPDINAVVDTGKERRLEVHDGIQGLFLKDISKADISQRKGRAGRTMSGMYILCSDTPFKYFDDFSIPEIQRGFLDQIVLRLASCGIDATQLEFFHKPDPKALELAKENLTTLGAIENGINVTPIGHKMAKMPVSVQSARMIIEAEKYGVVEDVITISSILEIGGLLFKTGSYYFFSQEKNSDLLAELDTWNKLSKMDVIDFEEKGINKKNYLRIKEHIEKMHQALEGLVEISSSGNRKDIQKSCLAGMISYGVFLRSDFGRRYIDNNSNYYLLDKKSCINYFSTKIIVGVPKQIEYTDRYGWKKTLSLVSMTQSVSIEELQEVAPQLVTIKEEISAYGSQPFYSEEYDAVMVYMVTYFRDFILKSDYMPVTNHPRYNELKAEYEASLKPSEQFEPTIPVEHARQDTVLIDGKSFKVSYSWDGTPCIDLDEFTLYNTNLKDVHLDNGKTVKVAFKFGLGNFDNIPALRNFVETKRVKNARETFIQNLPPLKSSSLSAVSKVLSNLGEVEITKKNGGTGAPIISYVCFSLKGYSVKWELVEPLKAA